MNERHGLRIALLVVTLLGLADASYLTWIKLTNNVASCIKGIGDCYTVNTSPYSEFHGIPIAIFGAGAYLLILIFLVAEGINRFWQENANLFVFAISLFGVLYSMYLTYIEIAVLKAICPFCVASALAMVILLILSIVRMTQGHFMPST
ncbi:MAG: vitamin K epoxide reductase family protein [Chloroflexi bacterium]|nr:vitamin K epoxide reductase family protein [Chloroflexota bacterium]